ncbi:porin [Pararobbsia silviterrae]|nr:porin [Pararobbsia silviterrae]
MASSIAMAQSSVSLYGSLDIGAQYLTHADTKGDSSVGLQSGNAIPSYFGIKGSEDLGGGYAAVFRLESGITMNNGGLTDPSSLFSRYAYVGLQSPYGTVEVGRQFGIMFDETLFYDPTYLAQYSVMSTGLIALANLNPNNGIKYISPNLDGFEATAMYGFGEQIAGNFRAGTYIGAGVSYKGATFHLRGVFEQTRGSLDTTTGIDTSGLEDTRASIAATWNISATTLFLGFANVSGDLELSPPGNIYWAGVTYQISSSWSVLAEFMRYDTHGGMQGRPNWYVLGSTYSLSPRTSLYAYAGVLDNHGGKDFTLNTYDFTSSGGVSQTGVQLGITHQF